MATGVELLQKCTTYYTLECPGVLGSYCLAGQCQTGRAGAKVGELEPTILRAGGFSPEHQDIGGFYVEVDAVIN